MYYLTLELERSSYDKRFGKESFDTIEEVKEWIGLIEFIAKSEDESELMQVLSVENNEHIDKLKSMFNTDEPSRIIYGLRNEYDYIFSMVNSDLIHYLESYSIIKGEEIFL